MKFYDLCIGVMTLLCVQPNHLDVAEQKYLDGFNDIRRNSLVRQIIMGYFLVTSSNILQTLTNWHWVLLYFLSVEYLLWKNE